MALPLEEKLKFEEGDGVAIVRVRVFTWSKKAGVNAVDGPVAGRRRTHQRRKNGALAFFNVGHRTYPAPTTTAIQTAVTPFVRMSLEINNTMLRILNDRLGLPEGTPNRCIPLKDSVTAKLVWSKYPQCCKGTCRYSDNWSSQILDLYPFCITYKWFYVKHDDEFTATQPLPGHAISNIGDALSVFSGGILQSNIHCIVPPPGIQAEYERWDLKVLRPLVEDSPIIADAMQKHPDRNLDAGSTAAEWPARRIKY
ncbi:hypothetical protein HD554DRAFT_2040326 [Boletus coccyginus]|nr:hypothetical protein HD554DRAFT_2040326 [Boletus coccyginus]